MVTGQAENNLLLVNRNVRYRWSFLSTLMCLRAALFFMRGYCKRLCWFADITANMHSYRMQLQHVCMLTSALTLKPVCILVQLGTAATLM